MLPLGFVDYFEVSPRVQRTLGPRPTPVPTKTAEQVAKEAERQRIRAAAAAEEQRKAAGREAQWLKTKAGKIWQKHKDWDRAVCETIAQGKVHIGMTAEQCRAAWGPPEDVNRTTYSFGVHEQWSYGEYCGSALYFEDGILKTIQN
jgi:hypothetical protein